MTDALPADRSIIIADALRAALEALRLVRRELDAVATDAARWRWVALGLVTAMQGGLVAALAGYETAERDAILNPSQPDRIAPVALLLRRARSPDYLTSPERIDFAAGKLRRIERILDLRNAAVHGLRFEVPAGTLDDMSAALALVDHCVLGHPAFDPAPNAAVCAMIADELRAIARTRETLA